MQLKIPNLLIIKQFFEKVFWFKIGVLLNINFLYLHKNAKYSTCRFSYNYYELFVNKPNNISHVIHNPSTF